LIESHRVGILTGDIEHALMGAMSYGYNYLFVGLRLSPLASDMKSFGNESRQFGLCPSIQLRFSILHQTALNLQGTSISKGHAMDQKDLLMEVKGQGQSKAFRDVFIFRLMLAYVFRDLHSAKKMITKLSTFPVFDPVIARSHLRQAFTGLSAFALSRKRGKRGKNRYQAIANASLDYFKKAVKQGSLNAYPIYCLLLAEKSPSKEAYDKAISVCSRSGNVNFAAIANESTALYFFEQGDEDWAMHYLSRALILYGDWGALGKVNTMVKTMERKKMRFRESVLLNSQTSANSSLRGRSRFRKSLIAALEQVCFTAKEICNLKKGQTNATGKTVERSHSFIVPDLRGEIDVITETKGRHLSNSRRMDMTGRLHADSPIAPEK
jgi:hypothetical protein